MLNGMQPARHITPPDWMTDHRCVKIMRILGGNENPAQALFVGGCVRNTLMGKPVKDIDIATRHAPLQVIELLKAAGIRFVPTGLDHGTVTAIVDDATFEITTLRKDIDTNGRHAVIAFTDKWEEDGQRRDFTMNTLLASPMGDIFDPTGAGLDDLDKRRVVFVGDPAQRIAEDYLRILRFFRFCAAYGDGAMDASALAACKQAAEKVSSLSKERVTQELLKILAVVNPAPTLAAMFANDILRSIGKAFKRDAMETLCEFQGRYDAVDVMTRLFTVAGMKTEYFADWLILSNAQKKHLDALGEGIAIIKSISKKKVREMVYRVGNAASLQAYLVRLVQKGDLPDLEMIDVARYWHAPVFPISGEQLIKKGVSPGPALGKKLKELEEKWIKSDFSKVPKV